MEARVRNGAAMFSSEIETAGQARERISWLWMHVGTIDEAQFRAYDDEMDLAIEKLETLAAARVRDLIDRAHRALINLDTAEAMTAITVARDMLAATSTATSGGE